MFTVAAQRSSSRAEDYFDEYLSVNDYSETKDLRPGQWIDQGAEHLGLRQGQVVTREVFSALCENTDPPTRQRLTQRQNEQGKRRICYDFACSPSESRFDPGGMHK